MAAVAWSLPETFTWMGLCGVAMFASLALWRMLARTTLARSAPKAGGAGTADPFSLVRSVLFRCASVRVLGPFALGAVQFLPRREPYRQFSIGGGLRLASVLLLSVFLWSVAFSYADEHGGLRVWRTERGASEYFKVCGQDELMMMDDVIIRWCDQKTRWLRTPRWLAILLLVLGDSPLGCFLPSVSLKPGLSSQWCASSDGAIGPRQLVLLLGLLTLVLPWISYLMGMYSQSTGTFATKLPSFHHHSHASQAEKAEGHQFYRAGRSEGTPGEGDAEL